MTVGRILKSCTRIAAAVASIAVALSLSSCTPATEAEVAARVNGQTITVGQLIEQLHKRHGAPALVDIIDRILILQKAEEAGISASEEEVDLRWQRAIAEAGSRTDMRATLEKRGETREQYREKLRIDLLLDKIARASAEIPEQEIVDFYREHSEDYTLGRRARAKMILVSSEANAQALREALREPEASFEGLAKQLSIDPATKDKGGDMGWFERDDYTRAITDVAFDLEPGQISEPIEVPDGWVLLKVEGHKEPGLRPLEEVRDEVRSRIMRVKLPEARAQWIEQARKQAVIQIHDANLRETTQKLLENAPPPQSPSLLPVPPPR